MTERDIEKEVRDAFHKRLEDFRIRMADESWVGIEDYGRLHYTFPRKKDDQREGFFSFMLSEDRIFEGFQFYVNPDLSVHRIEYRYTESNSIIVHMLFRDEHKIKLAGEEFNLMEKWFERIPRVRINRLLERAEKEKE